MVLFSDKPCYRRVVGQSDPLPDDGTLARFDVTYGFTTSPVLTARRASFIDDGIMLA